MADKVVKGVRVTHKGLEFNSERAVISDFEVSSWQINDTTGVLTIGDFAGNPEACFAAGQWTTVRKLFADEDDDE